MYFHKHLLPPDCQDRHGRELVGTRVEFQFVTTKDGKDRCDRLWIMGDVGGDKGHGGHDEGFRRRGGPGGRAPLPPQDDEMRGQRERRERQNVRRDDEHKPEKPPPPELPELDDAQVEDMTRFLEDKGGVMDYGRFSNTFPNLKKAQLEQHFHMVPEVAGKGGGRWQIMLHGVEPLTPQEREEREAREKAEKAEATEDGVAAGGKDDLPPEIESDAALQLEPSPSMRLLGRIVEWDRRSISGFASADGYDSVIVETDSLPQELQNRKDVNLEGCEVTFELATQDDGQPLARNVHFLLQPEGDAWGFRRI